MPTCRTQAASCLLQAEKRKLHALEKTWFVKAVCRLAADGCGCKFAEVRPRSYHAGLKESRDRPFKSNRLKTLRPVAQAMRRERLRLELLDATLDERREVAAGRGLAGLVEVGKKALQRGEADAGAVG